jgi:hypothetical protein
MTFPPDDFSGVPLPRRTSERRRGTLFDDLPAAPSTRPPRPPGRKLSEREQLVLLGVGVLIALLVFVFIRTRGPGDAEVAPPLPPPTAFKLGAVKPTTVQLRVGDNAAPDVTSPTGGVSAVADPTDPTKWRYTATLEQPDQQHPILELTSINGAPPVIHALRPGTAYVSVQRSAACPPDTTCNRVSQDVGSVQVIVRPDGPS